MRWLCHRRTHGRCSSAPWPDGRLSGDYRARADHARVLFSPGHWASGGMADAHGSGPCVRKDVGVQLPPRPHAPGDPCPRKARTGVASCLPRGRAPRAPRSGWGLGCGCCVGAGPPCAAWSGWGLGVSVGPGPAGCMFRWGLGGCRGRVPACRAFRWGLGGCRGRVPACRMFGWGLGVSAGPGLRAAWFGWVGGCRGARPAGCMVRLGLGVGCGGRGRGCPQVSGGVGV